MGKKSREKKLRREEIKKIRLWHYTTEIHFATISEEGVLKPTGIYIDKFEKPALWFSTNSDWERSVTKVFPMENGGYTEKLQRDDLVKIGVTPVRIEIDTESVDFVDWKKFKKISGISYETARNLEHDGIENGADPREWYATFDTVGVSLWKSIDFWDGEKWIEYDLDNINREDQHVLQLRLQRAELSPNSYNSIGSEKVPDDAKSAYDILRAIRSRLVWSRNPGGGMTVDFDPLTIRYGKENFVKVYEE